jgi:transcriptional regulator with XRE-family HTH domain
MGARGRGRRPARRRRETGAAVAVFARRVRERREVLGLTQPQLADRAGLCRTEVGKVERCLSDPWLPTVVQLARGLDMSPAALVDGLQCGEHQLTLEGFAEYFGGLPTGAVACGGVA